MELFLKVSLASCKGGAAVLAGRDMVRTKPGVHQVTRYARPGECSSESTEVGNDATYS